MSAVWLSILVAAGLGSAPLWPPRADEETVAIRPEDFKQAERQRVVQKLKLRVGEELTIVLPRLYGGHIWKRQFDHGPEGLPLVGEDQFYQGGDVKPGDISYVAYTFRAEKPGPVKLEFRFDRARVPFRDSTGPSYLAEIDVKPR